MGSAGARKGTAIGPGRKLLKASGYNTFAADAISKEMFLADMGRKNDDELEELNLDTLVDVNDATESYVVAEEFNDFMGQGDLPFCTRLTNLWDNLPEFRHPKLHGKSIYIYKPTINILGANTQQNFAMCIPPEAVGNGFCSRFIFVHSEPTGRKITFPSTPSIELKEYLIDYLRKIKARSAGAMSIDPEAIPIFDRIYKEFHGIDDHRFTHYNTRRFTHLLKLCIITAAANSRKIINADDAINCNTVLYSAEKRMPKALGEFGKARNSAAAAAILDQLNRARDPQSLNELWKVVSKDLNKFTELQDIIVGLTKADKIQLVKIGRKQGYLPMHRNLESWDSQLLNLNYLTEEERGFM